MMVHPDPRRWWALALLGAAFFMVILDATIVLTAVPSLQQELGLSVSGAQWVLTAYALAFGGLMLFFGRVADLTGRRRVFMVGLALFALSSLACGLAGTPEVLLAGRVAQGVAAAVLSPTALALVMIAFPEGPERNKALAVWAALGGVGATAGLLVGGVITAGLGWEWIFLVNVPVGAALFGFAPFVLRESRDRSGGRVFDPVGAVTVTAALTLLVYAAFQAPQRGWLSGATLGLLAGSALLMVLFVLVERRSAAPLLPLGLLRIRTVLGGNLVILAAGMAVDGMLFPLTIYAQDVLGYTALQFGLASAVMTVMSIVGSFAGQALVTRLGLRPVAAGGMLLIIAGSLLLTGVSVHGSFAAELLPGLLVFGPGLGAAFVAAQIAGLTGVHTDKSGVASGLLDTAFNVGSALGVAVATSVAVARAESLMDGGVGEQAASNRGFQAAFAAAAVFAVMGLAAAVAILPRSRARADDPAAPVAG